MIEGYKTSCIKLKQEKIKKKNRLLQHIEEQEREKKVPIIFPIIKLFFKTIERLFYTE